MAAISNAFSPLASFLGGLLIGAAASILLLCCGKVLGAACIINGILVQTKGFSWRILFFASMLAAGGAYVGVAYATQRTPTLDPAIAATLASSSLSPAAMTTFNILLPIISGLIAGFGSRMGSGCTSSHGICGLPRLSPRSFVAVGTFMATGFLTATICGCFPQLAAMIQYGGGGWYQWDLAQAVTASVCVLIVLLLRLLALYISTQKESQPQSHWLQTGYPHTENDWERENPSKKRVGKLDNESEGKSKATAADTGGACSTDKEREKGMLPLPSCFDFSRGDSGTGDTGLAHENRVDTVAPTSREPEGDLPQDKDKGLGATGSSTCNDGATANRNDDENGSLSLSICLSLRTGGPASDSRRHQSFADNCVDAEAQRSFQEGSGVPDLPSNAWLWSLVSCSVAALLFGAGLALSGMVNRAKVIGFLDPVHGWDPSLAFVMGGAVVLNLVTFHFILRRPHPLFEASFSVPKKLDITLELIIGSALFGIGWGLFGLCPGPAIVNLVTGQACVYLWVLALLIGMLLYKIVSLIQTLPYLHELEG